MTTATTTHIEKNASICGGRACVAGTRIRVQDIYVWHELEGQSVDEIISSFPQLSHADVHAALAWYWDHRDEIHEDLLKSAEQFDRLRAVQPSLLNGNLKHGERGETSVSP